MSNAAECFVKSSSATSFCVINIYGYCMLHRLKYLIQLPFCYPYKYLTWYVATALGFTIAFWLGDGVNFSECASQSPPFVKYFYFSVVTITTLGYGDALPSSSAWMIAAAVESLIGVILLGIFLVAVGFDLAQRSNASQRKKAVEVRDVELAPFYASVSEVIVRYTSIRDGNEMAPDNTGTVNYYRFANGREISVRHVDLDAERYRSMLPVLGIPAADVVHYHSARLESLASHLEALILAASSVEAELQLRVSIAEQVATLRQYARLLSKHRLDDGFDSPAALAMCRELILALTGPRQLLKDLLRKSVSHENGMYRYWAGHYESIKSHSDALSVEQRSWFHTLVVRIKSWFK